MAASHLYLLDCPEELSAEDPVSSPAVLRACSPASSSSLGSSSWIMPDSDSQTNCVGGPYAYTPSSWQAEGTSVSDSYYESSQQKVMIKY